MYYNCALVYMCILVQRERSRTVKVRPRVDHMRRFVSERPSFGEPPALAGRYRITHGISPTVMMLNNTAVTVAVLVCMPYIPYPGYMKVSSHLHRSVHMRVERVSLVRTCIGIGVWQPANVVSRQEQAVVLRRQRHGGVYSVDPVAVARR